MSDKGVNVEVSGGWGVFWAVVFIMVFWAEKVDCAIGITPACSKVEATYHNPEKEE